MDSIDYTHRVMRIDSKMKFYERRYEMGYPIGKKERELIEWISSAIERRERLVDQVVQENKIICRYEARLSDAQKRSMHHRLNDIEQ